jgi:hypothetical protein
MRHAKQLHHRRYLNDYLEIINREGLPGNLKNDSLFCLPLYFRQRSQGRYHQKTLLSATKCGIVSLAMLASLTALSHLACCPTWSPI